MIFTRWVGPKIMTMLFEALKGSNGTFLGLASFDLMSRGDGRGEYLSGYVDRRDFIKALAEACQKTGWQVHAYLLPDSQPLSSAGNTECEPGDSPQK